MAGLVPEAGLMECRKYYNDCTKDWFVFEKPHRESVQSFSMDIYEVTQAEYEKVMGTNLSMFKGSNLPVDGVTWDEANDYCQKMGKRLPTEWEWEFAARGGKHTIYAWGNNGDDADRYAWHARNSGRKTHPVGQKEPNGYGLYDMAGNILEWTASEFEEKDIHRAARDEGNNIKAKVLRGGSWADNLFSTRVTGRYYYGSAGHDNGNYGFRCAQ